MKVFIWLFLITIVIVFMENNPSLNNLSFWNEANTYRAKIIYVTTSSQSDHSALQSILALFFDGPYNGKKIFLTNIYDDHPMTILYTKGDWIFIQKKNDTNKEDFFIKGPVRDRGILILLGIFVLSLLFVGGKQGFRALLSLGVIYFLIFKMLIPLTMKGYNPIAVSIAIAIISTVLTLLIVSGFNGKTVASIVGTIFGVLIASYLAWFFGNTIHLTGCADQTTEILQYSASFHVDFKGLLFAGIIVGALGAVMDMTMSIASAIQELKISNPKLSLDSLVTQGLKVGKDIIGTMTNTLILAYVGGAFSLILLFAIHNTSFARIINSEEVSSEIVRILAGSIGLISAVPITAFVAAITAKGE